jgi:hypothetical protein
MVCLCADHPPKVLADIVASRFGGITRVNARSDILISKLV